MRKSGLGLLLAAFILPHLLAASAAAGAPIRKGIPRTSPAMASTTLPLLIGAGALFLILLVVFIVRLSKLKPKAAPAAGKTQVSMNLGAGIVVDRGPDRGKEFSLHKPVTTIGRPGARKNDIELEDDTVSKKQASLYFDAARKTFSIADENATNPTLVKEHPISGPTLVENEAVIQMGRTILRLKKT